MLSWSIHPARVLGIEPKHFLWSGSKPSKDVQNDNPESTEKPQKIKESVLSPEARLGLMWMLEKTEGQSGFAGSISELSRRLQVSRHVVRELTGFMRWKRWLKYPKTDHYQFTEKFYRVFGSAGRANELRNMQVILSFLWNQAKLLDEVVKNHASKNLPAGKVEKSDALLLRSSQYLLSVLLFRADTRGVVTGLNKLELGWLAGMSKERVHSQIMLLKGLGVIGASVGGVTIPAPFGKLISVYILNLQHPCLGSGAVQVRRLSAVDKVITPYNAELFCVVWPRPMGVGGVIKRKWKSAKKSK